MKLAGWLPVATVSLATSRSWKHLAKERIVDARPTIPLGKRFWPLSDSERHALEELFATERLRRLARDVGCDSERRA